MTEKRKFPWSKQAEKQRTLDNSFVKIVKEQPEQAREYVRTFKQSVNYVINGVKINFPFKAYGSQISLMGKIIKAISNRENALLESPTGTGKTLSILVASLAWLEHARKELATQKHANPVSERVPDKPKIELDPSDLDDDFQDGPMPFNTKSAVKEKKADPFDTCAPINVGIEPIPKIYIASRTHKQLEQMVHELRSKTNYTPRTAILGSREQYCVHPKVSKSASKNEDCEALVRLGRCKYHNNVRNLQFHHSLAPGGDREDLVTIGKTVRGCPYYAASAMADSAKVVFAPYNYIISTGIREAVGINLENSIVIIDEAHNIEGCASDAGSIEVTERALIDGLAVLKPFVESDADADCYKTIEHVFKSLGSWLTAHKDDRFSIKEFSQCSNVYSGAEAIKMFSQYGINSGIVSHIEHALSVVTSRQNQGQGQAIEAGGDNLSLSNHIVSLVRDIVMILKYLLSHEHDLADGTETDEISRWYIPNDK